MAIKRTFKSQTIEERIENVTNALIKLENDDYNRSNGFSTEHQSKIREKQGIKNPLTD